MSSKFELNFGLATVTKNGLFFQGALYTNAKMLKHQWFEMAKTYGEWNIPVLTKKSDPHVVYLWDSPAFIVTPELCENSEEAKQAYFEALQSLKRQLACIGKAPKKHDQ